MDTCTRLFLVRHGQVVNFSDGGYNGHRDVDITEFGVSQMAAVASRLKNECLAAVYCSDLLRAKRGAEVISAVKSLIPECYSSLRELNVGLWEGLSLDQIEDRFPGAIAEWRVKGVDYRIPGGESIRDLAGRVIPSLKNILKVNKGGNVVIVAHGMVNRVILADAMNLDLRHVYSIEQDFGCLNIIEYFSDFAVVKLMNGKLLEDRRISMTSFAKGGTETSPDLPD